MSESRAALRYAKALMELAQEQKKATQIEAEMRTILDTITENESLQDVLASPILKTADKESVLNELYSKADPLTHELFALLGRNKRVGMLGEVANQFIRLYEKLQGQDVAKVTTAVPLTSELEAKILAQLKQITGSDVALENEVDPSLIGGFILRVGDLEYNASVANTLANLKRDLIHT
jgi:F-type H+-transporting ATPase subunit delta